MLNNIQQVLEALLVAKGENEITKILKQIGDSDNVDLDKPFGPFGFKWHAFGDNLSNNSTIGLATKPGRSITERLTNAMDALLEERALSSVGNHNSPGVAAAKWYGRPISGPDNGLFNWNYHENNYDRRISVVLNSSGVETAPTIDVIDNGIGLRPDDFASTILTLQGCNKIQKSYLIGSFGQGGASALGFCEYAMIVSRYKDNPETIGFTIIRILELPKPYKDDCYAYLYLEKENERITVPSCKWSGALNFYETNKSTRLPVLDNGTLIRHYTYKLGRLNGKFYPSPGNLYHYLHCSLFDPLLPFRIIDLREKEKSKNEIVTGSRNRLMKLVKDDSKEPLEIETGSELKHYRPMEYVVPLGFDEPCIGIEYWVIFNYRKMGGPKKNKIILRSHSNELFIQKGHPIIATMNGQNQGELTATLLRNLGLSMVARHCIIHIDATKVNNKIRRELFSTSREGFKDGLVKDDLERVLIKMLEEDELLHEIERELTEKLIKDEATKTRDEVKRNITRLLVEAGYAVKSEGPSDEDGNGDKQVVRKRKKGKPRQFSPLPTLPFPEVTRFEIVTPKPKMHVRIGDNELILVETDADAEFDNQGKIAIRWTPESLELAAKAPLRGGRIRWRLRPKQTANIGETGEIVVSLTKPDGSQINDKIEFEVLKPLEKKSKESRGYAPPFEVIGIDPENDPGKWNEVWDNIPESSAYEKLSSVAYKPMNVAGTIYVYYSKIFGPYEGQLEKIKLENPSLVELFTSNYETWIGYHGILQINNNNNDSEEKDDLLEEERIRVAKMQIKQATETAKLMKQNLKNKLAKED